MTQCGLSSADQPGDGNQDEKVPSAEGALEGTWKNYFESKGFGFVIPADGGPELFAHVRDNPNLLGLPPGVTVTYNGETCERSGKPKATNVMPKGGFSPGMAHMFGASGDTKFKPVFEMTQEKVAEITNIILSEGGQVSLGRLSQEYLGVKPSQLREHFLCETGQSGIMVVQLKA